MPEKEVVTPIKLKADRDVEIAVSIAAIKSFIAKGNN